jgi:chromosome segregation ATPase
MEQKAKFFLFGLVGVIIIIGVFLAQTLNAKQQLERERDALQKEKASMESRLESLDAELRNKQNKISSLNSELKKLAEEKDNLQVKYDMASKAKEELVERLKERQKQPVSVAPQVTQGAPQSDDVYWGGILQAKLDLEMQLTNVRSELKSLTITNEQLQREKSKLELDINALRRDAADSKREMEYNKKILDRISGELVAEKNDRMKIQESMKIVKNENVTLLRQIESLNSRKIDLEQKLRQIQEDKVSIERKFKDMEILLNNNLSQVNELKENLEGASSRSAQPKPAAQRKDSAVELAPIVVRPQGSGVIAENRLVPQSGRVLAINKEGNFVIVDMGDDAGIKIGDIFQVSREGNTIGSIEVIKTSKSVSACDIKKQDAVIKIGDLIK